MERHVSFHDHICDVDSDHDYEAVGQEEPDEDRIVQCDMETRPSSETASDALHIDVFREYTAQVQMKSLQRNNWSTATQNIISSMPSVTAGRNRNSVVPRRVREASQRRKRPNASRDSSHPRSAVQEHEEDFNPEENKKAELMSSLRGLSVSDGVQKLRAMPLGLAEKMELRRLAFSEAAGSSLIGRNLPCCSPLRVYVSKIQLPVFSSLQLWHTPMKKLSGRFGTGVLSYFLFLRTLLLFNIFLFVVNGLFVVFPQVIFSSRSATKADDVDDGLKGLDVLTGTGYLSQSVIFYGYYTNVQDPTYSIPSAYFFTVVITFFTTCMALIYSVSKSFGKSFQTFKSNRNLAVKVFCSWDFKVSKKTSVVLQSEKISTQLKELLSDMIRGEVAKSCGQRFFYVFVHLFSWAVCLGSIALSTVGLYHLSEGYNASQVNRQPATSMVKDAPLLILPAVVSAVSLLLPGLFNLCAWAERHDSPSVRVYVSIFRNLLLKVSIVGVLCYRWLVKTVPTQIKCWESFIGQELYRLLLVDFLFTVLHTMVGEFLWSHLVKRKRKPAFDIARNVLELIYGQTLTWLGVLFAPLLPAVQIMKLFVLFYMKKSSLMLNCQASTKPWMASKMTTLFLTLLCFPSFFGSAASVTYAMLKLEPSSDCGPFMNINNMFHAGKLWLEKQEKSKSGLSWVSHVYRFLVTYPLFLFLTSGVFLLVIYFHAQVVDGQRKIISRLEKQIENEGKDKNFLITKLQELHEQEGLASTH